MCVEQPWLDLRVIHFDRNQSRLHEVNGIPSAPTSLAPWRTWLCGHYHPCPDASLFQRYVQEAAEWPTFLLVHQTDLNGANEAIPAGLTGWLTTGSPVAAPGKPVRCVVIYASGDGPGDCARAPRQQEITDCLPQEHWCKSWCKLPWDGGLIGVARPLAWLGDMHGGISLPVIKTSFGAWQQEYSAQFPGQNFDEDVTYARLLQNRVEFRKEVRDRVLKPLLTHALDSTGAHPSKPQDRRSYILIRGDHLWLLEGFARMQNGQDWLETGDWMATARCALEAFLLPGRGDGPLSDSEHEQWEPTREILEACISSAET